MKDESIFVRFNPPLKPKLCDHSFLASVKVSACDSRFLKTIFLPYELNVLINKKTTVLHYMADGPGSLSCSEAPDPSLLSHFLPFDLVTLVDPIGVDCPRRH